MLLQSNAGSKRGPSDSGAGGFLGGGSCRGADETTTTEGPVELPRNTVTQMVQISWNWGIYTLSSGSGEVVVSGPVEAAQTLLNR